MYTEGSQTTGHHRFLQHTHPPCPCQHCIYHEQPYEYHRGSGYHPASARQTDHSSPDCRRDIQAPRGKDVGGRVFLVDRVARGGQLSPQRRPVCAGPGLYGHSNDFNQVCPWELNPAQWSDPEEPGVRRYSSARQQCDCVEHSDRTHPLHPGIPHPLPHLQVKGQGYRRRRTVRYISVDEEEGCACASDSYHLEPHSNPGNFPMTNGHSGPRRVFFEEEEERDNYQDQGRLKGGSEYGFDHCSGSDKSFFSTEVPLKHLSQRRQKGSCIAPSSTTCSETSKPITNDDDDEHQRKASEETTQKTRRDSVRDQIRQVVTDLEEVLGGLKQVHVEMKEVVEQIDRLTANIDLSEKALCITQGSTSNDWTHAGDFRVAPLLSHKPASAQAPQQVGEDRIILRTNSVSPVHMASVVKTSRFTPPSLHKDVNHKKPSVNGHPPQMYHAGVSNHTDQIHPEHHPQTLDPKVIIGNSTSNPRTQKPPPYPQNGRCGKGQNPSSKPVRTPAYPVRGRHSTSMV